MDVRAGVGPARTGIPPGIGERTDFGSPRPRFRPAAGCQGSQAAPAGEGSGAYCGRTGQMPRQRTNYSKITYAVPDDFAQRLKRFKEESGLSWLEIARRLGTYRHPVWRWVEGRVRPNVMHMMALLEVASDPGPRTHIHRVKRPATTDPETQKGPHTTASHICVGDAL